MKTPHQKNADKENMELIEQFLAKMEYSQSLSSIIIASLNVSTA
jgi:hypothetical protein